MWLRVAAVAALVVGVGYIVRQNRQSPLGQETASGGAVYRSATIETVAPTGDVSAASPALTWSAVAGAVQYVATIREVAGSVLWPGSTPIARADLPAAISAKFVAGK